MLVVLSVCGLFGWGLLENAHSQDFSVWWSPNLGLIGLDDIPQRLEKMVRGPQWELSKDPQRVPISTCAQYLRAKDNGFSPRTQFDQGMEGNFIGQCFALRYLQKAKPATRSYMDHNGWSTSALSILPPLLADFGVESGVAKKVEQARAAGQSWQSFDPSLKLEGTDGYTLTTQSEDRSQAYSLEILARGDFNGDGIEDLAVLGCVADTGGTFRECVYYILTRPGPNAIMSVVAEVH
jgi:hypothetical protein